jgi:hypothetical protein
MGRIRGGCCGSRDRDTTCAIGAAIGAYGRNKAIAASWNRLDETRIFGIVVKRLPQLCYCGSQALPEINESILRPKALPDSFAIDHSTGIFQQQKQQFEWLILQFNAVTTAKDFARFCEDLKGAKTVHRPMTRRANHASPWGAYHELMREARLFSDADVWHRNC